MESPEIWSREWPTVHPRHRKAELEERQLKQASGILAGFFCQFFRRDSQQLRQGLGHPLHIGRLIAFAAEGGGSQKRAIGFHQKLG